MAKYEVRKDVRFTWQVEAADGDAALSSVADLQPETVAVLRERARNLERKESRTPLGAKTPKPADLAVGTHLHSTRYHGKSYEAEIVEGEGGQHLVKVGGKTFRSLSMAGTSITGKACRGGQFWQVLPGAGEPAPAEQMPEPAPTPRKRTKRAKAKAASKPTARARGQGMRVDTPQEPPQERTEAEAKEQAQATTG